MIENPKKSLFKQRFDLPVKVSGEVVKRSFEIDPHAQVIAGILLTTDSDLQLYHRGSQLIKINDLEFLPEGFQSRLLMSGLNVAPIERIYPVDLPAGNRRFDVAFQDTAHPDAPFTPYVVSLYVFSEP